MRRIRKVANQENLYYCDHCDEYLVKRTYFKHKRKYINIKLHSQKGIDAPDPFGASSSEEEDRNPAGQDEHGFLEDSGSADDQIPDIVSPNDNAFKKRSIDDDLENEPEVWGEFPEDVIRDLDDVEPLPEPHQNTTATQRITALLQWFVLFILLWQANSKVSDNAIEWLLRFVFQFLYTAGVTCDSQLLIQLSTIFPTSLYLLRQSVNLDRDNFQKFVVCPQCSTLYAPENCTIRVGGKVVEKCCPYKRFKRSRECGQKLARKVILNNGTEKFYPFTVFCYNSIINQIETLLKRPGVPDKCEQWRNRESQSSIYTDVYDGKVWNDFLKFNRKDFLNSERSLAFALNVDWFQPFTRRTDVSVGVIYFVLLNLPREERFKWENVIVAGIIPDMKQMPKSLNSFMEPVVDEFQALWKGVRLHTSKSVIPLLYRGAILCAASDIPAARKLCGFKGHTASRGCSKCFRFFPGSVKTGFDRSGFDRENWPPRSNLAHRRYAEKVKRATTNEKFRELSKKFGTYYSVLLKLEYFDAVRFTVIDPMHNLYQGTAKTMFKLWKKKKLLTERTLKLVEKHIEEMDLGTGYGRLPTKISSNYGGYTASQWKNWTTVYSLYALDGLLPEAHLRCWHTFVLACRFLSTPMISVTDLKKADMLFLKFGKQFEALYGKKAVSMNIHLHCHLKECVEDFGPVYSFWCFAFERFNGILGATITNNRSIEVQLMRKLISSRFVWNIGLPGEFRENFAMFFNNYCNSTADIECKPSGSPTLLMTALAENAHGVKNLWADLSQVVLPKVHKLLHFDRDDLEMLAGTYSIMYPENEIRPSYLGETCRRLGSVVVAGEKFGSKAECRSFRSARVMASWACQDGQIDLRAPLRPGQVKFHFVHSMKLDNEYLQHVFACVQWYSQDECREQFKRPIEIWKLGKFDPVGPATFIPVQRLYCKFATATVNVHGSKKTLTSPILRTLT